jgi:hypothetical protein
LTERGSPGPFLTTDALLTTGLLLTTGALRLLRPDPLLRACFLPLLGWAALNDGASGGRRFWPEDRRRLEHPFGT